MKIQPNTNLVVRSSLALALTVAIFSPVQALSSEPSDGKNMTEAKMMEQCKEMMAQKQKMMEDMKAQDAELTDQLAKMNSAPDDKKIGLMAAVLTRLVEQRSTMNARRAKFETEMMSHMMKHMEMGEESMSQCPMMEAMMMGMKGMKGTDEKPADAHKEHHEELK